MNKTDIKKLVELMGEQTGCDIQYNKCPCGRCFQSQDIDYKHLSWLLLLSIRGDYDFNSMEDILIKCLEGKA